MLFGLAEETIRRTLNDYLWRLCDIEQTIHEVPLQQENTPRGQVFLIPANTEIGAITRVLREGYDLDLLDQGLDILIEALQLDFLLLDTPAGLNETALFAIAKADVVATVMRPDLQDYQGTGVLVEMARHLAVPHKTIIVNQVPKGFDLAAIKDQVASTYRCKVSAVVPYAKDFAAMASGGLFVLGYTHHPLTAYLQQVAMQLASKRVTV